MAERISEYFSYCAEYTEEVMSASGAIKEISRPLIPTIEDLCGFIGITRATLIQYRLRDGYTDMLAQVDDYVRGRKMSGLINGKGSTAGLIFDLTNNYGMKDARESREEKTIRVVYDNPEDHSKILPDGSDYKTETPAPESTESNSVEE